MFTNLERILKLAVLSLTLFGFISLISIFAVLFSTTVAVVLLKIAIPFAILGIACFIIFAVFIFSDR